MTSHPTARALLGAALLLCGPLAARSADPLYADALGCLNVHGDFCDLDTSYFTASQGVTTFPYEQKEDLGLPTGATPPDQAWLRATRNGSVRGSVKTGQPPAGSGGLVDGYLNLVWTGTFSRSAGRDVATFTINKSWVEVLNASGQGVAPGSRDPYASYLFVVHVYRDADHLQLYDLYRWVALRSADDGQAPPLIEADTTKIDFVDFSDGGNPFHSTLTVIDPFSRRFETEAFHGTVSLAQLGPGETYTVWYGLVAWATIVTSEEHAEAFVGDPFDGSSGFQWDTAAVPAAPAAAPRSCQRAFDAGRWSVAPDGTATDLYTGLMWQRCAVGRAISGGATAALADDRCTGTDLVQPWSQALQGAVADRLGGFADWRVPDAKELESILDTSCAAPAIETQIFPDTTAGLWWSSTPDRDPTRSRQLSFLAGGTVSGLRTGPALVRLVRDPAIATREPLPMVSLGRPAPVAEGNTGSVDLVFPVGLDRPAPADVTVDFQTADVTAAAGLDYLAAAGTLTIPAGVTRSEVRVAVLGDLLGEPDEGLAVVLSSVSPGARLGVVRQVGTILDDEPVVSVGPAQVLEGNAGTTDLAFPVALSRVSPADVTVSYATADGTATAGVDYTAASGALVIPAGQAGGTIHVAVAGDPTVESDETLTLALTAASTNATLGAALARGTILNDDLPGPPVLDAIRYAGDMGGPGNADGAGPVGRLKFPTAIGGGLVADSGNSRLRTLGLDGTLGTAFPDAIFASGIAIDPGGGFVVAEGSNNRVLRVTGAGPAAFAGSGVPGSADGQGAAASFRAPAGVAVDGAGNAYVVDSGNHTIRLVTPGGLVSTVAGAAGVPGTADGLGALARFSFPQSIALDPATGTLYVGDGGGRLRAVSPGGLVSTVAGSTVGGLDAADPLLARFRSIDGLVVDGAGAVFIADGQNHAIRRLDAAGVSTLAGTLGISGAQDGHGAAAGFTLPLGIALGGGDLWVTDNNNHAIRRVTTAGDVVTMAGAPARSGSTNGAADAALFRGPKGVAPGAAPGILFVADTLDSTLRRIDPDPVSGLAATVTAVAGLGPFRGSADGLGGAARFNQPWGVGALGSSVADTANRTLRRVDGTGNVTTVAGAVGVSQLLDGVGPAARFLAPNAIWAAPGGTVYLSDTYAVRRFDPATGAVTTVAGAGSPGSADGLGGLARFNGAEGLCGDTAGNLYVADPGNSAVRKILPSGEVQTLNRGGPGYLDGPLAGARFLRPTDVACAADGSLYVADADNLAIRKISAAGDVTTLLGTPGRLGFDPMGTPSVIGKPLRLALDGQALYVTMWQGVLKVTLR